MPDCIVLTYDVPHRKTYDTLNLLKNSGYDDVIVWSVPMHYKKKFHPLYEHRPEVSNDVTPEVQCSCLGYRYVLSNDYEDLPSNVPVLVCGAGLIPERIIKEHKVINAHPGYIPLARGLDALKWEIYEGLPIGVTTHYIGDEVDAGIIIERKEVPLYKNDTFHALAQRVYDNEILMLVNALKKINGKVFYEPAGDTVLHKRMGPEFEKDLLSRFEDLVKKIGIVRNFAGGGGYCLSNTSWLSSDRRAA